MSTSVELQGSDSSKADWERIAQQDINYHLRQFHEPYRSTVALGNLISSQIGPLEGEALDVGCGAGANIFYLSRLFPALKWTGIDMAGDILFDKSRNYFLERNLTPRLLTNDFYHLKDATEGKQFDLVISMQTLLVLPDYERALGQLLAATSKWLVISSLITDFQVDVKIETTDYHWPAEIQKAYYNVYSMSRLRGLCESQGAKLVTAFDFHIDIDLQPPRDLGLGTYTRTLDSGLRLQFTGPVYMPWKFVFVRMF